MKNLLKHLQRSNKWVGLELIAQVTNEEKVKELLNTEKVPFYIGFEPTADSLHVGHFVQLMIMYYIIFSSSRNGIIAAVLAFGINSGAYVAEIVRSGIMSIDKGQFEASRSLGFNYSSTMLHVILPQAFKNVLPALGNEFIVLVKETSVAGYVALQDLTYVGNLIRSRTYEAFFPLISVAAIYLVIVLILTYFLKKLERRLRSSDH